MSHSIRRRYYVSALETIKLIKRRYYVLGLILLTGFTLRVYRLTEQSLWIDEIYSISIRGNRPVNEILFAPTLDSHPPLHYVFLHYWIELFGNSVAATRIHAVLIGLAGIFALYLLGAESFNPRVGLLAAAFLAVSPMHLNASRTVRMYGLLSLLAILSTYYFILITKELSYRRIAGYTLSTVLLLVTHPYAVFIIVAQNVYVLSTLLSERDTLQSSFSIPQWIAVQALIALWALPGLGQMLKLAVALSSGTTEGLVGWIPEANRYVLFETLLYYAGLPSYYPYLVDWNGTRFISLVVLLVAVICIGVAFGEYGSEGTSQKPKTGQVDGLYLLSLVLCSAIILPFMISRVLRPIYHIDSTIVGLFAFFLIVAVGVSKLPTDSVRALAVVVLIGGLVLSSGVFLSTNSIEPWDEATAHIESNATEDDLVVFNPHWIDTSYDYYSTQNEYGTVGLSDAFTESEAEQLQAQAHDHERVWVISRFTPNLEDVAETVESTHTLHSHERYGQIHVLLFVETESVGITDGTPIQFAEHRFVPTGTTNEGSDEWLAVEQATFETHSTSLTSSM